MVGDYTLIRSDQTAKESAMHAKAIIQKLLDRECGEIHAKRRRGVADLVQAGSYGQLTLMGLSRHLNSMTTLSNRIKRVDRLLGNEKLQDECIGIYAAVSTAVLRGIRHPAIIVDWSDVTADRGQQLLRASVVIAGRSMTLYEEVHLLKSYAAPKVHQRFISRLKGMLPVGCEPVFITDAGFRAPWFKLLNRYGYAWIGRIRNRDTVRCAAPEQPWQGCKHLYAKANTTAQDLGEYDYVRSNRVACRLVLIKKRPAGRHRKTVFGKQARSKQSQKHASGQTEPWLLAVSPNLAHRSAAQVVELYGCRMQIEQTFRDTKNPRWGLGLSQSQTRVPNRWRILLMVGALVIFALWMIGLAAQQQGYRVEYGSREKAAKTVSIISLARWWLEQTTTRTLSVLRIRDAMNLLCSMVRPAYI